jgi:hypothetical protein
MPATCFGGCGRRLRFGKKRASGHGAEVRRLRSILEVLVVPTATAQGTPHQQQQLARVIEDGQTLEGIHF